MDSTLKSGDKIVRTNLVKRALWGSGMLCCGLTIIGCIHLLLNSVVFSSMLTSVLIAILVCDMYFLAVGIPDMLTGCTEHVRRLNHIISSSNDDVSKLARSIAAKLHHDLLDRVSPRVAKKASTEEHVTELLKACSQPDQANYDAHSFDYRIDAHSIEKTPIPFDSLAPDGKPLPPNGKDMELDNPLYSQLESDKSDIALVKATEDHQQTTDSCEEISFQRPLATELGSRSVPQKSILLSPVQCVQEGNVSILRGDNPPSAETSTEASTHSAPSDEDSSSYVKSKPPDALPTSGLNTSLPSSESPTVSEMLCSPNSLNSSKSQLQGLAERHLQSPQTSVPLPSEETKQLEPTCKEYESYVFLAHSSLEHQSASPQSWPFSQPSGNLPTFNELIEDNYGIPYLNCVEDSLSQDQLENLELEITVTLEHQQLYAGVYQEAAAQSIEPSIFPEPIQAQTMGASNIIAAFPYLPPNLGYLLEPADGLVCDVEPPQAHEVEASNHDRSWIALLEAENKELVKFKD